MCRQTYDDKAQDARARNHLAMSTHLQNLTPTDHFIAVKRRNLLRKLGRPVGKHLPPAPANMPKRPASGRLMWQTYVHKLSKDEQRQELGRALEGSAIESIKFLNQKWNEMEDSEKNVGFWFADYPRGFD